MTLRFHSKLYRLAALEQAARDFEAAAELTITRDGDYHQVELASRALPEPAVADEFANYALALMKS